MAPNTELGESNEQYEQRLKAALWANVRSVARDQAENLQASPTPQFVSGLVEVIWTQIESTGRDLEMFARHAGRSTVNASDMMLLTRRNSGLETILQTFTDEELNKKQREDGDGGGEEDEESEERGGKKRKRTQKQPANQPGRGRKTSKRTSTG